MNQILGCLYIGNLRLLAKWLCTKYLIYEIKKRALK